MTRPPAWSIGPLSVDAAVAFTGFLGTRFELGRALAASICGTDGDTDRLDGNALPACTTRPRFEPAPDSLPAGTKWLAFLPF